MPRVCVEVQAKRMRMLTSEENGRMVSRFPSRVLARCRLFLFFPFVSLGTGCRAVGPAYVECRDNTAQESPRQEAGGGRRRDVRLEAESAVASRDGRAMELFSATWLLPT